MNFSEVERDFLRAKVLPDFEWTAFHDPTTPTPLTKPISTCSVALVATAGAYIADAQPHFDIRNPQGDDSFRLISAGTPSDQIALSHPGYDTRRALNDLDTVFPLQLLKRLAQEGSIGAVAPRHVSFMGFIPRTERLIWDTAPQVGRMLRNDGVDLVVLVPS
jgi:D-proline reductase (dithiol) PrdB